MKITVLNRATNQPIAPQRPPVTGDWVLVETDTHKVMREYYEPQAIESAAIKMVEIGDIINTLPLGTKRQLFKLAQVENTDGDIADLILSFLQIGKPVNVLGDNFKNQAQWMINQPTLNVTQAHIDEIQAL